MQLVRPIFLADWTEALFIHFRVDPRSLGAVVPLELDTRDGEAFVSLVAFTQRRLRPSVGGRIAEMLSAPLAEHAFLNLRAYVRVNGEAGIFFISEWIPNRLAVLVGPRLYGLPYKLGALRYEHSEALTRKRFGGCVVAPGGVLRYRAGLEPSGECEPARGSIDAFLLERYVAYTCRSGVCRRFRVVHEPWAQTAVNVELEDRTLLDSVGCWACDAELIGANNSPGVSDVGISAPEAFRNFGRAIPTREA